MLSSKGSRFAPWESRFNTFVMLEPETEYETKVVQQDTGISLREDITWAGGRGHIRIDHITTSWFGSIEEEMTDRTLFDRIAASLPHDMSDAVPFDIPNQRIKG
jgi:hypothetical protein